MRHEASAKSRRGNSKSKIAKFEFQLIASAKRPTGSVLSIRVEGDSKVKTSEEVEPLRQVLGEMSRLNYPPQNLEMISTWLQHSEYQNGIDSAVLRSGSAKGCNRTKYCHEAESTANQFLKSVNAFKEFDSVLSEYGLKRKSVNVDDIALGVSSGQINSSGLIVVVLEKNH